MAFFRECSIIILLALSTVLFTSCELSYNDSYDHIQYLKISKNDSSSFEVIRQRFKNKEGIVDVNETKLYHTLKDSVAWFKIDLSTFKNKDVFVTFREAFTEEGAAYYVEGNKIKMLSKFQFGNSPFYDHLFYKSPTWYISKSTVTRRSFFLKVKTNKWRNRKEFFVQDKNAFLKRVEIEYISIGLFVSFMVSLILILSIFAILKKEYSILFYAGYIVTVILEFMSIKGIAQQFIWGRNEFLIKTSVTLYLEMAITQAFFLGYFYKFTKKSEIFRKIALGVGWTMIPLYILASISYYYNFADELFNVIVISLQIVSLFFCVVHIILMREKKLPKYVAICFVLVTFSHFIYSLINPSVNVSLELNYLVYNLRPILIAIEMICITRFIFDSVIKSQQQNNLLTQINEDLKANFQTSLIDVQVKERNEVLGNVHDSFGGYLESLKIRLSMNPSPEKLKEIIDSFYKEYRILLNNIYSPKVDNDNFKQYLIKYLDKIEALDILEIGYHVDLGSYKLSREACIHLYRIISESFTNILKHAKATKVMLHFTANDDKELELIISDNGIGFKEEALRNRSSYGLKSIEERVEKIGGLLEINSDSKHGTILNIVLVNKLLD